MARRFNFELDLDLGLEGYDFESRLVDVFEVGSNFATAFTPNIAPQALFSESYTAFAPVDSFVPFNAKDDNPAEAPQLPGQPLNNSPFGATFELSSLLAANGGDGSLGFVINGIDIGDISGVFISDAGDVNGDGIDDIIIGASNGDPNGTSSGESYVVFGSSLGFGASFELSSLNGSNGYIINGIVRRHIKWHRFRARLRETLLTSLFDIKRQLCGIASVDVRLSFA